MLETMDEDHSGAVDLAEWMAFMEQHGMGADSAAFSRGGGQGFKMDLKTALTFIQNEVHTSGDLTQEEHEEIQLMAAAHCLKDHHLHRVTQAQLASERFFFGLGGFSCAKCTVHSENLASKEAWFCSPCHYVLCVLCANVTKKEAVQREVHQRLTQKRSRFQTIKAKTKDMAAERSASKSAAGRRNSLTGLRRASSKEQINPNLRRPSKVPLLPEPESATDLVDNP